MTLLKHLNPQLRSSDTLLDLAYINSSMQASYTSLVQNIVGMAALLEARPRQQVLIMCPAGHCWSTTRLAQIVQQLTGSLGCCLLHCTATCCNLPLAPSIHLSKCCSDTSFYGQLPFPALCTKAHIKYTFLGKAIDYQLLRMKHL